MELIIRIDDLDARNCDRLSSAGSIDVIVEVDADHSMSELCAAIERQIGERRTGDTPRDAGRVLVLQRTGGVLEPGSTVGQVGIVSGDTVFVSNDPTLVHRQLASNVARSPAADQLACLDVLAGPDAGYSQALTSGRFSVGRDRSCDVELTDPTVSRRHLDVSVGGDGTATIDPRPRASNPVRVNAVVVSESTEISADDVVTVGGTRLALRPLIERRADRVDHLGQVEYQRTPYRPPVISERPAPALGKVPVRRDGRRFQVMSALAPVAAGLTFYAFSKQPQFLIITLMSPLAMIGNVIEDRRHGRRTFRSESAAFADRLIDWRAEIDDALEAERVERLRAAPDLAQLARRVEGRTVDLWPRGRADPDFLSLRTGLGCVTPLLRPTPGTVGDDELLDRAWAALDGTDVLVDVPVSADLATAGVFGIHGPTELVDGIACSFVMQAACLHSPEDLVITAAVSCERAVAAWLKWLPHVRAASSPLEGAHVVTDASAARSLVVRLLEIAEERVDTSNDGVGGSAGTRERRWPWMFAVLDSSLESDHADIARLLDLCPAAGMSVVWLAAGAGDVPRQAAEVLVASDGPGNSALGTVWSTDPAVADRHIEIEQLRADIGDHIARSLAPLRDASTASAASSVPRIAPLLDVLGVGAPTAAWVAENWSRPKGYGLAFPIGMGADGPLVLDLVEDGPHTLIGGTSGAGKSELLQSVVASLAVHHSPQRLNFLFVDYKGGASSTVFGTMPHTVGYVTNLNAELSLRALTSLRAELNRRMQMMEGKAKDLAEMLELYPDEAPPSLVIVVDEFATLVKEVPDFVDGIVDIAQRGRSLGIHLVLATQRPAGCVSENILANTNLRISLRMLDRTDSMSVIGSAEAADIPVPLKGRAFARLGPRSLASFQSAFTGAGLVSDKIEAPVLIAAYESVVDSPRAIVAERSSPASGEPTRTHLDAVLESVVEAAANSQMAVQRKPWRDVLPQSIELQTVLDDQRSEPARRHPGRVVALGMIDVPEHQDQIPALVDLERGGGLMIFGSGGSGKTTALRTLATSASLTAEPGLLDIFGFDFASRGLASISPLPTVVDVAASDDLEVVTRHLVTLHTELDRRRSLLAAVHAEDLTAYNERHDRVSRVLVLVDGCGGLVSIFNGSGSAGGISVAIPMDRWSEMLGDLVVEGRQVGIHVVITADRRSAVPSRLHSAISNRLILRHADEQGYGDHGIPMARSQELNLGAGRGLWQADSIVQIAAVAADASADVQGRTLLGMSTSLENATPSALGSQALPDLLDLGAYPGAGDHGGHHRFVLGCHDRTGAAVAVDLEWSNFVVAGAGRSGRSTTLNTCASGLVGSHELWGIGSASSGLDRSLLDHAVFGRGDGVGDMIKRLRNLVVMGPTDRPHVVLVDDLDVFDGAALTAAWEHVVKLDDVRVIASVETRSLAGYTTNPLLTALKRARRLLLLQPDDPTDVLQIGGVKSPIRPGTKLVPGRGVLIVDREPSLIQVGVACSVGREQVQIPGPDHARIDDMFDQSDTPISGEEIARAAKAGDAGVRVLLAEPVELAVELGDGPTQLGGDLAIGAQLGVDRTVS